jgi:hypothetical protein
VPGFGKAGTARVPVTASSDRSRDADIYDRYAVGLYGQALLTLGDQAAAGHDRGPGQPPSPGVADCRDPGGLLTQREALGLVVFGGCLPGVRDIGSRAAVAGRAKGGS